MYIFSGLNPVTERKNHKVDMQPGGTEKASISISQKLANLSTGESKCYIYRVNDHLRSLNKKAYEPRIIAIGPYHHGTPNTNMMEKHKLLYLQSLLKRNIHSVDWFVSAIGEIEQEARGCYADPINLCSAEFIEMMLLDGCFIIELLRKYVDRRLREEGDPIFETEWMLTSIRRDLMLFENQIPFFVLWKLFELIDFPNNQKLLALLILWFFNSVFPGVKNSLKIDEIGCNDDIKHLLELIHFGWSSSYTSGSDTIQLLNTIQWQRSYSATKLRDANVKFEINVPETPNLFQATFDKGTLKLSHVKIDDGTEALFRNLIAYEQYFPNDRNFVTDYVLFLDFLIDSPRDVEILRHHKILENCMGTDEVVSDMFVNLTDLVTVRRNFNYANILKGMSDHCNRRKNNWMAKLRRNYLHSPWAILSIIAAAVLLLLTLAQTVFSALQVV